MAGVIGVALVATTALGGCSALGEEAAEAEPVGPTTTEADPKADFLGPPNRYCLAELPKADGRSFTNADVMQGWLDIYAGLLDGLVYTLGAQPAPKGDEAIVADLMAKTAELATLMRGLLQPTTSVDAVVNKQRALQTAFDQYGLLACKLP